MFEDIHEDLHGFEEYEYFAVVKSLALLRENSLKEVAVVKNTLRQIAHKGVSIGISPSDDTLKKYSIEEINTRIQRYLMRQRESGIVFAKGEGMPPPALLIGEYSNKHRWHYHGVIFVKDIKTLDKIKRGLNNTIGRCVTEEIKYVESYVNYCFKQYDDPTKVDSKWNVFDKSKYISTVKIF